jgi:hypothetical protein
MPYFHVLSHFNYIVFDKNLFILSLTFVELPIGYSCAISKFAP